MRALLCPSPTNRFTPATLAASAALLVSPMSRAQDLAVLAQDVGITAESLVAADVSLAGAAAVLAQLDAAQELKQQLLGIQASVQTATLAATDLAASIGAGASDGSVSGQYQTFLTQITELRAQIDQLEGALLTSALPGLSSDAASRLIAWKRSAAYRVPSEFRVLQLSASEWRALELALRAEQRAQRTGEEFPQSQAQLLAQTRGLPEVSAAKARSK